ncbi:UDP-N-acetylmuramate--L-alanine ligase [soil metagenome]
MSPPESAAGAPRFDFHSAVPTGNDLGRVHFVAIGGAGVSSVALAYLQAGHAVSGSDQRESPALHALREAGATVFLDHDAQHLADADTVIISGAVPETNPEVIAARERGIPVLHRAQGIAALSRGRDVVAVAGANGKTTTSAMLVAALLGGSTDPGYIIGSPLVTSGRSAHLGAGPMVVEADESDGSFVTYRPRVGIVTNVMADHLDFFGDFAGVQHAFRSFVDSFEPNGVLVANADDPGAAALADYAGSRLNTLTWGLSDHADVRLSDVREGGDQVSATLTWSTASMAPAQQDRQQSLTVPMAGLHNLHNAAAAVLAAVAGFRVRPADAVAGVAAFGGTRRRFEVVGDVGGVRVIDDYAHNPAKVAAVVAAGRSAAGPQGRVVVAFQPHLYSRTRDFAADFAAGLSQADVVMVLDVYGAREEPIPGIGAETIADLMGQAEGPGNHRRADKADGELRRTSPTILASRPLKEAAAGLARVLEPGDVMLTVGAGDVTTLGPQIISALDGRRHHG